MDSRWQPNLGPVPTDATLEACALPAAGWQAQAGECRIAAAGRDDRVVSPETWRSLRDRGGFLRPRVCLQRH
jgi:hypothetical protein